MYYFNFKDYIKCIHSMRINCNTNLQEETQDYIISKKINYQKILDQIFNYPKELQNFVNQYLNPNKKLTTEELIKYKRTDELIYKLREKNIYVLIIHKESINLDVRNWNSNKMHKYNIQYKKI